LINHDNDINNHISTIMSQKKDSRITPANILAMLGLAAIGVITFFGALIHSSDGKPTFAIIWAIIVVAVLGFFLFLGIKAKSAEDNPDKWKYIEWTSIVAYIACAVLFSASFLRFFYMLDRKEDLQKQARIELKEIKDMRSSYDQQRKTFITQAAEQLENYNIRYANGNGAGYNSEIAALSSDVDAWREKALAATALPADNRIGDIESRVNGWNLMGISSIASDLEKLDNDAWTRVENHISEFGSRNGLIPVIAGGIDGTPFDITGLATFELGEKPVATFTDNVRNANGSTVLGWIVYVLLNAIVLLNILVTSRSNYVGPGARGNNPGGQEL